MGNIGALQHRAEWVRAAAGPCRTENEPWPGGRPVVEDWRRL